MPERGRESVSDFSLIITVYALSHKQNQLLKLQAFKLCELLWAILVYDIQSHFFFI